MQLKHNINFELISPAELVILWQMLELLPKST